VVKDENGCEKMDCGIKRERCNTVWTKQQERERDLRKITKIMNVTFNGIERQNSSAKLSEESSLAQFLNLTSLGIKDCRWNGAQGWKQVEQRCYYQRRGKLKK